MHELLRFKADENITKEQQINGIFVNLKPNNMACSLFLQN